MTHTGVKPVKITYHHEALDLDVRRVVGYEGVCDCGWTSAVRKTWAHARDDQRRHRREHDDAQKAFSSHPEGRCRLRVEPHPPHVWRADGLLTADPPWFRCPGIKSPKAAPRREEASPSGRAESS